MSVIDPAMLDPLSDEDSEWEYEYHDTEAETFFLNLDLTTHHGPIRPSRRRNDPAASTSVSAGTSADPTPASSRLEEQDAPIASQETDNVSAERVQILGLHTRNPIISYRNQVFSGSWADQLGTELFFARPDADGPEEDPGTTLPPITPLKHTKDFDLISANSVKILGRRANLISSSGQVEQSGESRTSTSETAGVYKPAHQSNQARFLERLKDVKARKGEMDTIRTVFSTVRRGPNLEDRLRGWEQTEEQLAIIQQLQDQAGSGDYNAQLQLENIYAHLGNQHAGLSEGASHLG
ncbi:hypothetical protein BDV18DRAFT_85286 [Aspergillus unguis]